MAKDPAFLFYPGDWMGGTMILNRHQKGCYIDLLIAQFNNGPLSFETIKTILGQDQASWTVLAKKFKQDSEGNFFNERLVTEIEKRKKFLEKQFLNGLQGGRPKKHTVSTDADWDEMLQFFENTCLKCEYKFPDDDRPTKDHIIPKVLGGNDLITNLQPLCRQCNASKCADHQTDYRLKYFQKIPDRLKMKWFIKTQTKPKNNPNKTLLENENENEDLNKNLWVENKKQFLNSFEFKEKICRDKNLEMFFVENEMKSFISDQELKEEFKPLKELKSHFINLLNLKLKNAHIKIAHSGKSAGAYELLEEIKSDFNARRK